MEEAEFSITHVGLILVIFMPELALTNSLLMKRPVGSVILRPLGAVSSTFKSAILENLGRVVENTRTVGLWKRYREEEAKETGLEEKRRDFAKDPNM